MHCKTIQKKAARCKCYERGRCSVRTPAITSKTETQANEHTQAKTAQILKNASTLHASKQRKRRISNWNLDTVSQSSENSKNENENDAIEEKWFQMKKYMQAKN